MRWLGRSWQGRGPPGRWSAVLYTSPARPPLPTSTAPLLQGGRRGGEGGEGEVITGNERREEERRRREQRGEIRKEEERRGKGEQRIGKEKPLTEEKPVFTDTVGSSIQS